MAILRVFSIYWRRNKKDIQMAKEKTKYFLKGVINSKENQLKIKKPMFEIIAEIIDRVQVENGNPKSKNHYEDYPFIFEIVHNIYTKFWEDGGNLKVIDWKPQIRKHKNKRTKEDW